MSRGTPINEERSLVRPERNSKHKDAPLLDDDAGRGEVSKEGFKDYDQEFHPAEVEIEGDPSSERPDDQSSKRRDSSVDTAARKRFEVHFRTMNIRSRGDVYDDAMGQ